MSASMRNNQLNLLACRIGYNVALRHFRMTQELAADMAEGYNLADLINVAVESNRIEEVQIRPIVNILLVEKHGYASVSGNIAFQINGIDELKKVVEGWSNIQVVLAYTDSNDGVHLLNPERPMAWRDLLPIKQGSYLVCYAGYLEEVDKDVLQDAASDILAFVYNKKTQGKAAYRTAKKKKRFLDDEEAKEIGTSKRHSEPVQSMTSPVSKPPPSATGVNKKKISAKVAVNVTNELFHNGNVEAWKRIIESYRLKYPHLDVLIWYEGEHINDINALFKWGKVKHGVPILFSVVGETPVEISKLRKYLFEGASSRFEAFLHGGPGNILRLF